MVNHAPAAGARPQLDGAHPAAEVELGRKHEVAIDVGTAGGQPERRLHRHDEVRCAELPSRRRPPAAGGRSAGSPSGAPVAAPAREQGDLGIREAPLVAEPSVARDRLPGRHAPRRRRRCGDVGGPLAGALVGRQAERADAARTVAAGAVGMQDRRNVAGERHRQGRLARRSRIRPRRGRTRREGCRLRRGFAPATARKTLSYAPPRGQLVPSAAAGATARNIRLQGSHRSRQLIPSAAAVVAAWPAATVATSLSRYLVSSAVAAVVTAWTFAGVVFLRGDVIASAAAAVAAGRASGGVAAPSSPRGRRLAGRARSSRAASPPPRRSGPPRRRHAASVARTLTSRRPVSAAARSASDTASPGARRPAPASVARIQASDISDSMPSGSSASARR